MSALIPNHGSVFLAKYIVADLLTERKGDNRFSLKNL
jgi:hypothetical protein